MLLEDDHRKGEHEHQEKEDDRHWVQKVPLDSFDERRLIIEGNRVILRRLSETLAEMNQQLFAFVRFDE